MGAPFDAAGGNRRSSRARGKSTREIADVLHLSSRTVEAHVAAVCNKMGVRSRIKLAGALLGAGPPRTVGGPDNLPRKQTFASGARARSLPSARSSNRNNSSRLSARPESAKRARRCKLVQTCLPNLATACGSSNSRRKLSSRLTPVGA
ncbi:MAG: helix-turn-helix transcriptional regulator [Candidatus Eremiobacteraeota bacterium]|nr:helix-turn-helix transcriptional regulator [Candidatus Eremiobacteraeota bacterium]